jgi:hypothetical protein
MGGHIDSIAWEEGTVLSLISIVPSKEGARFDASKVDQDPAPLLLQSSLEMVIVQLFPSLFPCPKFQQLCVIALVP